MELLFDLLGLSAIRKKRKKIIEVIDRLLPVSNRRGEAAGVKPIALLWNEPINFYLGRPQMLGCLAVDKCRNPDRG